MNRLASFPSALITAAALFALVTCTAQAQEVFSASGTFTIVSIEDHIGQVVTGGDSQPGGAFSGGLIERYSGNFHKIRGAGSFDYGGGDSLSFEYELRFDPESNLDHGPLLITGGTGAFAGASGSGILVADHALEGRFDLLGTIFW